MARTTRDAVTDIWGQRTPYRGEGDWPVRVDERTLEEPEHWIQSGCVLCSNGCALDIGVKQGRIVGVRGRAVDAVNCGRLGPKGLHGWEANHSPDRLMRPLVKRMGQLQPVSWDDAMDLIVQRTMEVRDRSTASAIGFYTSGQLFLEEYYTLALIGKAGLGTPHMDGNTRLCTATAAAAFKESFGADGQPGSYTDIEHCDAIFLFGHNMAETQTVLWARVLDRTRADDPPVVVCVDPRRTPVAAEAERTGGVHLAPRVGTNLALMNGLLHELFANGWVHEDWVGAQNVGVEELGATVKVYPPERVASICGVPADDVRRAARIFGTSDRVLSTVLQGFYQSHQ